MAFQNLMKMSHDVETGFIAGKTYKILNESKRKLSNEEIEILKDGLSFINKVSKGKELVSSGRLQSDAVSAIDAYAKTLITVSFMDKDRSEEFEVFIDGVRSELEDILKKRRVAKTLTKTSRLLFKYIREYTVNELSKKFYNEYGEQ